MTGRLFLVDTFIGAGCAGNPAAVLLTDVPQTEARMRALAVEFAAPATAFVSAIDGAWHLRWFSLFGEIALCGHGTLAAAFVLHRLGAGTAFHFLSKTTRLEATADATGATVALPAAEATPAQPSPALLGVLGAAPEAVLRSHYLIAVLASAAAVAALRPRRADVLALPEGGLIVTAPGGMAGADITSRYFAPAHGADEDAATGSLHARVVPYWAARLGRPDLACAQASPRGGWLRCTHVPPLVRVSGQARLVGETRLPA